MTKAEIVLKLEVKHNQMVSTYKKWPSCNVLSQCDSCFKNDSSFSKGNYAL